MQLLTIFRRYKELYRKKFIRKSGRAKAVYLMGFKQKAHFCD